MLAVIVVNWVELAVDEACVVGVCTSVLPEGTNGGVVVPIELLPVVDVAIWVELAVDEAVVVETDVVLLESSTELVADTELVLVLINIGCVEVATVLLASRTGVDVAGVEVSVVEAIGTKIGVEVLNGIVDVANVKRSLILATAKEVDALVSA